MSLPTLARGKKYWLDSFAKRRVARLGMGLAWKPAERGLIGSLFGGNEKLDLDLLCSTVRASGVVDEHVSGQKGKSKDGSVEHPMDCDTGAGHGDDEQAFIDLGKVPDSIDSLVLSAVIGSANTFGEITAAARLFDAESGQTLVVMPIDARKAGVTDSSAWIGCRLFRREGRWAVQKVGQFTRARLHQHLDDDIARIVNTGGRG